MISCILSTILAPVVIDARYMLLVYPSVCLSMSVTLVIHIT